MRLPLISIKDAVAIGPEESDTMPIRDLPRFRDLRDFIGIRENGRGFAADLGDDLHLLSGGQFGKTGNDLAQNRRQVDRPQLIG